MGELGLFQVDAFTNERFSGNPAGVCPLDSWLDDQTMQNIAAEMNLAETAFFVPNGKNFELRWFTPTSEVDLCGHATLATAHILFQHLNYKSKSIRFETKSGILTVEFADGKYHMNFPSDTAVPQEVSLIDDCINSKVLELYKGKSDYMAVLENEESIKAAIPNFQKISELKARGLIITAKGNQKDFVCRCFYPSVGVNEDSVTGSAYTLLTPYWAIRLNKNRLEAAQLSSRGGQIVCSLSSNRIILSGEAVTIMKGKIFLKDV